MLGGLFGSSRAGNSSSQNRQSSTQKIKLDVSNITSEEDRQAVLDINQEFINSVLTEKNSGFTLALEKTVHVTPISYILYYFFPPPQHPTEKNTQLEGPSRFASSFTVDVSKLIIMWHTAKLKTQITGVKISPNGFEITIAKTNSGGKLGTSKRITVESDEDDIGEKISERRRVKAPRTNASSTLSSDSDLKMRRRSLDAPRNSNHDDMEPDEDINQGEEITQARKRKRVDEGGHNPYNQQMSAKTKGLLSGSLSFFET
jgi:hypothetical protein